MSRSRGRPGYAFRQMVNLRHPPDIDDDVEGSMNSVNSFGMYLQFQSFSSDNFSFFEQTVRRKTIKCSSSVEYNMSTSVESVIHSSYICLLYTSPSPRDS